MMIKTPVRKETERTQHESVRGQAGPRRHLLGPDLHPRVRLRPLAMIPEAKQGRGLGLASFKAGWWDEAKITWMYSPGRQG